MTIDAKEWLTEFRALHEGARKGKLSEQDKRLYLEAREQLARTLSQAQGLTVEPGASARKTFRVAQAVQIELSFAAGSVKVATLDVSRGGFSTLLATAPDATEAVGFTLKLPGGAEPLVGRAKAVAHKKSPGTVRVSFAFEPLSEADAERLEFLLFDWALSRIGV